MKAGDLGGSARMCLFEIHVWAARLLGGMRISCANPPQRWIEAGLRGTAALSSILQPNLRCDQRLTEI